MKKKTGVPIGRIKTVINKPAPADYTNDKGNSGII